MGLTALAWALVPKLSYNKTAYQQLRPTESSSHTLTGCPISDLTWSGRSDSRNDSWAQGSRLTAEYMHLMWCYVMNLTLVRLLFRPHPEMSKNDRIIDSIVMAAFNKFLDRKTADGCTTCRCSKNRSLKCPCFVYHTPSDPASQLDQNSIYTPQTRSWSRRRNSSPLSSARQKISSSLPHRTSWWRPSPPLLLTSTWSFIWRR